MIEGSKKGRREAGRCVVKQLCIYTLSTLLYNDGIFSLFSLWAHFYHNCHLQVSSTNSNYVLEDENIIKLEYFTIIKFSRFHEWKLKSRKKLIACFSAHIFESRNHLNMYSY